MILGAVVACGPRASPSQDGTLFVSQAGSSTVVALDARSGQLKKRIEVGFLPHTLVVSPDGKTLYAVLVGSEAIAEIDTATLTLRRTFLTAPVPRTRDDGTVIQAHIDQNAFGHTTCYDCHFSGGALPKYVGTRPFGVLLSADATQLLVSHIDSPDLTTLDLAAGSIARTVTLEPSGAAIESVALARMGDAIWLARRPRQPSRAAGVLRRLDPETLAGRGDVPIGSDTGALLSLPGRSRVLASNFETDTVTELDSSGAAQVLEAAPGPLGLLAVPDQRTILALDYYSNAVSFLDLDTGSSQTLALSQGDTTYVNPTQATLSGDGRSAWIVSSGTDGHLLELDLSSRRILREVPIDGLSFGVAFVPVQSR
jgi:DNA-binding beta-propeller fold protein YncE